MITADTRTRLSIGVRELHYKEYQVTTAHTLNKLTKDEPSRLASAADAQQHPQLLQRLVRFLRPLWNMTSKRHISSERGAMVSK